MDRFSADNMWAYVKASNYGKTEWPWWVLGTVIALVALLGGQIIMGIAIVFVLVFQQGSEGLEDMSNASMSEASAFMIGSPLTYAMLLISFLFIIAAFLVIQKALHKRTFTSLLTAASRFRWNRLLFAVIAYGIITAGFLLLSLNTAPDDIEFTFDAARFWPYLIVTLIFIPWQAASEEIMFRGYFTQFAGRYLGYIISNKYLWAFITMCITSALFVLPHMANPEVMAEGPKMLPLYFIMGMFFALLVYIDGGLESAIGVHTVNNIFAATIMGYPDSALPTPTVWMSKTPPSGDVTGLLLIAFVTLVVMFLTRPKLSKSEA